MSLSTYEWVWVVMLLKRGYDNSQKVLYALKRFGMLQDAWDVGGQINVRNINWKDSCTEVVQSQKREDLMLWKRNKTSKYFWLIVKLQCLRKFQKVDTMEKTKVLLKLIEDKLRFLKYTICISKTMKYRLVIEIILTRFSMLI